KITPTRRAQARQRAPDCADLPPQGGGEVCLWFADHHAHHSGNVTMRVKRARIWSSSMPTTPITRIAMMTLVIERLFHSFQTKKPRPVPPTTVSAATPTT